MEIKLQEQIFFVLNQMTSVLVRANCCEHLLKILHCQWKSFLGNALDYNNNKVTHGWIRQADHCFDELNCLQANKSHKNKYNYWIDM